MSRRLGGPYAALEFSRPFVPGHEFVGEVIDYGPGSRRTVRTGAKVTSVPAMRQDGAHAVIGYSHACPGGFGELMLLDEDVLLELPEGLPDTHAALIEPLAVGLEHARRGRPQPGEAALVLGCGAIGLGVIAGLKLLGAAPIVAADFHPHRRELAIAMGADIAIDPREVSPYAPLPRFDNRAPALIYECVGRPGMLQGIVEAAPFDGRIVMGGYCMEAEPMFVFAAQNKRLNIQFAGGRGAAGHGPRHALDRRRQHRRDAVAGRGHRPRRRGGRHRRHDRPARAGAHGRRSAAGLTGGAWHGCERAGLGERHAEHRDQARYAAVRFEAVLQPQGAAVLIGDRVGEREPEPGAARLGIA